MCQGLIRICPGCSAKSASIHVSVCHIGKASVYGRDGRNYRKPDQYDEQYLFDHCPNRQMTEVMDRNLCYMCLARKREDEEKRKPTFRGASRKHNLLN
jgi:hypothetical protein